ncbi:carboxypeptidase regulatory-like domain-containing protein, partial [candidate division KSB1 bacterium]|nr:carboxypeptidase regulatory-like domain-containing protein [candidate division KSB1 bacterium]
MRKKPIYLSVVAVAVVFIFLLGPGSASGQLVVESSFPKDGDTNVDTLITVEFTFSAPLDTTADFPDPGDFYLGMLLPYDYTIGPPDSITISPDFKTVYFHNIRLMDNNRNIIGILAARSQDGDLLDIPCVITFTTADTLPTGSISGTISYPDGDPRGALVAIQSAFIGEDVFDGMTVVNSSSGEYTISYVDAGKYYPISVKDEDRNGELDLFGGSPFGFYNPDGDRKPDTVRVESGQNLADINIELK